MKATLTIEVPDDFKKGDCENCTFWCGTLRTGEVLCMSTTKSTIRGSKDDCPLELEIQEDIPMEYFENGGI